VLVAGCLHGTTRTGRKEFMQVGAPSQLRRYWNPHGVPGCVPNAQHRQVAEPRWDRSTI
jgi:hypothetical protein